MVVPSTATKAVDHRVLAIAAMTLSSVGLFAQTATQAGPDFVGIAALISSIGGLLLGTIAAIAAWRRKPGDRSETARALDLVEKLVEERQHDEPPKQ